jgi:endonuclease/exonuclease/phosphatase family metal-dependent hydrolase
MGDLNAEPHEPAVAPLQQLFFDIDENAEDTTNPRLGRIEKLDYVFLSKGDWFNAWGDATYPLQQSGEYISDHNLLKGFASLQL